MGQLLMKMYPELSCVQSDVLGTGKFLIPVVMANFYGQTTES